MDYTRNDPATQERRAADDRAPDAGSVAPERLAALGQRSNLRGVAQSLAHAALLAACTGAIVRAPLVVALLLVPLQGLLIASLFAPLHESVHFTVFRTRGLHAALAWPCALALGFVPTGYRYLHYEHHRNANAWNDPELQGRSSEWPRSLEEYAARMLSPAFPGLLLKLPMIARLARGPAPEEWAARAYVPADARRTIVREARLSLLAYALIAALCVWHWKFALATVVPAFVAQVFLAAYLFPEHLGCDREGPMPRRTRTIRTNGLVRFLFWNMPYHAEHHLHPNVPFHALPQLHSEVGSRLSHVTDGGYLRFHLAVIRGVIRDAKSDAA